MGLILGGGLALAFAALTFLESGARGLGPLDAALLAVLAPAGVAMLITGFESAGHRRRQRQHWDRLERALGAAPEPQAPAQPESAAGIAMRDPHLAKIMAGNAAHAAAERAAKERDGNG